MRSVEISREALAEARKEDIKVIWDATVYKSGFEIFGTERSRWMSFPISEGWEPTWTRLKQILDLTEEEYKIEQEQWERMMEEDEEDSDSWEESSGEEGWVEGGYLDEEEESDENDSNGDESEAKDSEEGENDGEARGKEDN